MIVQVRHYCLQCYLQSIKFVKQVKSVILFLYESISCIHALKDTKLFKIKLSFRLFDVCGFPLISDFQIQFIYHAWIPLCLYVMIVCVLQDWMGETPIITCAKCGRSQLLVCQIYCPLHGSNQHRTLYIFSCANKTCWAKSDGYAQSLLFFVVNITLYFTVRTCII